MGKAEMTKEKILDTATEIVATKGYAVSTTKEIANKSGVAEGTIFKYFKNKENLLAQIFAKLIESLKAESLANIQKELADTEKTTIERLRLLFTERQKFFIKHKKVIQIMVQEVPVNPLVKKLVNERVMPIMLHNIQQLFEEGIDKGEIVDLPIEVLQVSFVNAVFGPVYSSVLFQGSLSEAFTNYHKEVFEVFIQGIVKE